MAGACPKPLEQIFDKKYNNVKFQPIIFRARLPKIANFWPSLLETAICSLGPGIMTGACPDPLEQFLYEK